MTDRRSLGAITFALVGFLFLVELTSGILQGYYVPLISDLVVHLGIKDADFNWFEAAQLLLSALVVPVLAKLGDMFGHKRILLISTVLTAGASWWLAFAGDFTTLPHRLGAAGLLRGVAAARGRADLRPRPPHRAPAPRRPAAPPASSSSRSRRARSSAPCRVERGVRRARRERHAHPVRPGDRRHAGVLRDPVRRARVRAGARPQARPGRLRRSSRIGLLLITSGLTFLRINGPQHLVGVGVHRRRRAGVHPVRAVREAAARPGDRPAGAARSRTCGRCSSPRASSASAVLGAQAPLSTFAGTDPRCVGYGLGLTTGMRSILIGVYLISMIVGAVLFPLLSKRTSPRVALIVAAFFVAAGYLLFLPFHDDDAAGAHQHGHRRHRLGRAGRGAARPRPRRPRRAGRPASRPGSPTPRRPSAARSPRPSSASCSRPASSRPPGTAASLTGYMTVWIDLRRRRAARRRAAVLRAEAGVRRRRAPTCSAEPSSGSRHDDRPRAQSRPAAQSFGASGCADHLVRRRLRDRPHRHQVEVHVARQLDGVHDRLGDVLGDERLRRPPRRPRRPSR